MSIETIEPESANPVPMRSTTPLGTLMVRFVGLLFLAVTALALVWSSNFCAAGLRLAIGMAESDQRLAICGSSW